MTYYYTLITSLPRHSRQFKVKQTPLSRIQLDKRLKLLTESEQKCLYNLVNLVWDSWFLFKTPTSEIIAKSKPLLALHNPFIDNVMHWFFDIRSVLAALRLRKTQSLPPSDPRNYWYTHLSMHLIANWDQPDFGLKSVYPWILEINTKFSNNETDDIEDILLTQIWKYLDTIETRHFFDFEALIIYLLRWNIVNYWSQFNNANAHQRILSISKQIINDGSFEKNEGCLR